MLEKKSEKESAINLVPDSDKLLVLRWVVLVLELLVLVLVLKLLVLKLVSLSGLQINSE